MANTQRAIDVFVQEDTPEPPDCQQNSANLPSLREHLGSYKQPLTGEVINTPAGKIRSVATPATSARQSNKSASVPHHKMWHELDRVEFEDRSLACGRIIEPIPEDSPRYMPGLN